MQVIQMSSIFEKKEPGLKLANEAIHHNNKILQYLYELDTINNHLVEGWGLEMGSMDSVIAEMERQTDRIRKIKETIIRRLAFREKNYPIDE